MKRNEQVVLALLVVTTVLATTGITILPHAQGTAPLQADYEACYAKMDTIMRPFLMKLDQSPIRSLALSALETHALSPAYNILVENGVGSGWTFTYPECVPILQRFQVDILLGINGKPSLHVTVVENTSATQVTDFIVSEITGPGGYSNYANSIWNGYELYQQVTQDRHVWASFSSWYVPTAQSCYTSKRCDVGVWTGLIDDSPEGGNGVIAQDGVTSFMDCTSGTCHASYQGWYQFGGSGPANYLSPSTYPVYAGDSVHTEVQNQADVGGSQSSYYMQVADSSRSWVFSGTYQYSFTDPFYAEFIAEWAQHPFSNGQSYDLLTFNNFNQYGYVDYNKATYCMSSPYNNGWYNTYTMWNGNYQNMAWSQVYSSCYFTQIYYRSNGT
jgi:hypothetical protein